VQRFAFLFGLALTLAFVPWAYEDINCGRWAIAWIGVAVLLWVATPQKAMWSGIAFLAFACLSFMWAPVSLNAAGELLRWGLLAGAFIVGRSGYAEEISRGAAWGMGISSALAIAQFLGWHPVNENIGATPGGLFGNRDHLGEAALVVIIPCLWKRRYWLASLSVPAIALSNSRSMMVAAAVVGVVSLWRWNRSIAICALVLGLGVTGLSSLSHIKQSSASNRLDIWEDTAAGLTLRGQGVGQFYNMYPAYATRLDTRHLRPEHAHNDWLEIAYEFGIVGLGIALAFAAFVLAGPFNEDSAVFLAFCVLGFFAYPLHNTVPALLGILAAGSVYRRRDLASLHNPDERNVARSVLARAASFIGFGSRDKAATV
jgi:hypothetical protein